MSRAYGGNRIWVPKLGDMEILWMDAKEGIIASFWYQEKDGGLKEVPILFRFRSDEEQRTDIWFFVATVWLRWLANRDDLQGDEDRCDYFPGIYLTFQDLLQNNLLIVTDIHELLLKHVHHQDDTNPSLTDVQPSSEETIVLSKLDALSLQKNNITST